MSDVLYFSEHTLQEIALVFMGLVYVLRIRWLLRFKASQERQPTGARDSRAPLKGILYSWANIAMPWSMESSRKHLWMYGQFVVFHLGVVASIGLSFIIPYAPSLLENGPLVLLLQVVIGVACFVGLLRVIRRVSSPHMRAISSPDDYFSLILLTVWFFFAFLAVPNDTSAGEWHLLAFFLLTAFFLVYVPFSKISHYLYYPFTRYYLGKSMGYRGVYPLHAGSKAKAV